jgi:hypothetical protein
MKSMGLFDAVATSNGLGLINKFTTKPFTEKGYSSIIPTLPIRLRFGES